MEDDYPGSSLSKFEVAKLVDFLISFVVMRLHLLFYRRLGWCYTGNSYKRKKKMSALIWEVSVPFIDVFIWWRLFFDGLNSHPYLCRTHRNSHLPCVGYRNNSVFGRTVYFCLHVISTTVELVWLMNSIWCIAKGLWMLMVSESFVNMIRMISWKVYFAERATPNRSCMIRRWLHCLN